LQKEKRKQQDEKNKSQAKAAKHKEDQVQKKQPQPIDDDLVSESTATLQGSVVREGRRALPALLPDEILNAEPVFRLPSPPPEQEQKSTRQHKFFTEVDRPAKDLHRGDVTIRVLEDKKHMLPPKSSKSGRNVKAAWMAGQRGRSAPGGLKRVGGGPKSFVRR
jgi:U3 small nucleolar RNA-associated protein 16